MPTHDIHCIGASAGGVDALQRLLSALPANHSAAVCIVLHTAPIGPGKLAHVLQRECLLPVSSPQDEQPFEAGRVYVAPPDRHLLVMGNRLRVVRGPKENRHRPAIDPLFRSAAWTFGPRVVGVVLTGMLDDGTAGLWAIKMCGGVTVIQDPDEAPYPSMPLSARNNVEIDHSLRLDEIAPLLDQLARKPVASQPAPDRADQYRVESEFCTMDRESKDMDLLPAKLTTLTCPSCNGTLWEFNEGGRLRFRCHTGHAFGPESLLAEQADSLEEALYAAMRALQEQSTASRMLAEHHRMIDPQESQRLEAEARKAEERANTLRQLVSGERPTRGK